MRALPWTTRYSTSPRSLWLLVSNDKATRVVSDVVDFSAFGEVACDDLVAVEPDPHDRDLWAAIGFNSHKVSER